LKKKIAELEAKDRDIGASHRRGWVKLLTSFFFSDIEETSWTASR
jgi:hypothetical protein